MYASFEITAFFLNRIGEWKSATISKQTYLLTTSSRSYIVFALRTRQTISTLYNQDFLKSKYRHYLARGIKVKKVTFFPSFFCQQSGKGNFSNFSLSKAWKKCEKKGQSSSRDNRSLLYSPQRDSRPGRPRCHSTACRTEKGQRQGRPLGK